MNKTQADRLILQYQTRIFGFAMSKLHSYIEAEELAADIISEVYCSFLAAEKINHPSSYVYRIACNVYAKRIQRLTCINIVDISDAVLPYHDDTQEHLEQNETVQQLRSAIGFLSDRQRTIVYLHYYKKMAVAEIAKVLGISPGTVKWHLSDTRSTLKEELIMTSQTIELNVNPIRFTSMGHDGSAGTTGDTKDMFDTRLKQNIAWSCYFKPHSIEEIARTLGVPSVYIADNVQKLEMYGYLDRLDHSKNPKFRTNMVLLDARIPNQTQPLYLEAAKKLCDQLYPSIFDTFDQSEDNWGFSCDMNDKNFMKYTLVMLCTRYLFYHGDAGKKAEMWREFYRRYAVKRPDGGNFIAHATVNDDCHLSSEHKENSYAFCGYMQRDNTDPGILNEQYNCRFADRTMDWRDNRPEDWSMLYRYIANQNDKSVLKPEEYKRLCDKGYLADDKVQIMTYICSEIPTWDHIEQLLHDKCTVPQSILDYSLYFDSTMFALQKDQYPKHIQPIIRQYCTDALGNGEIIPYVIEEMLYRGMLQPLTAAQKKTVFSILIYQK